MSECGYSELTSEHGKEMLLFIRSRAFDTLMVILTLLGGLLIPIAAMKNQPKVYRLLTRGWSTLILATLDAVIGLTYKEIGTENKNKDGPCLYVCNHQSTWETLFFPLFIKDVAIVMKKEILSIPIFGWYLKRSPMIAIDRSAGQTALRQMMKQAKEAVAEGRDVLIFPEGSRMDVDYVGDFKSGLVALYKYLDVPVVPVAINSGLFWPKSGGIKRPGTITVSYLSPLPAGRDPKDVAQQIQDAIYNERDRLLR